MTIVDIFNQTLQLCGAEAVIITVDDNNKEARLCRNSYDLARRTCLQRHPWKFSIKRINLDVDLSEVPAFGYTARYLVPDDYIRIVTINELWMGPWTREGRYILYSSGAPIELRYVFDQADIEQMDPLFIKALIAEMAQMIVYPLTQSDNRSESIKDAAKMALRYAKRADAIEQSAQVMEATLYDDSRLTRTWH